MESIDKFLALYCSGWFSVSYLARVLNLSPLIVSSALKVLFKENKVVHNGDDPAFRLYKTREKRRKRRAPLIWEYN